MAADAGTINAGHAEPGLTQQFHSIRNTTLQLCQHLQPEDFVVQSMPDASPAKWHLAHTTWFFEHFVLGHFNPAYQPLNKDWHYLFNSYYYSVGKMHARPQRGLLTRPTVREVLDYREHVDTAVQQLLQTQEGRPELAQRTELGLHHEQQHQELLLTDIKHAFSRNPLRPAVHPELPRPAAIAATPLRFIDRHGGVVEIGARSGGFSFDNETPRHRTLLPEHGIGSRLVSNDEYREFIADGAYERPELWLSDGWSCVQQQGWNRPLYWREDRQSEYTLGGVRDIVGSAPVCHVSYYEADAFARWAKARLPTEAEWETAAADAPVRGNLLESGMWHPVPGDEATPQWFGDCWEWTASAYAPYPGFKPLNGSLGEYNGKFMCNQMTVRGGSCVTSASHIRATYRSFFYPQARWQFLGIRLARDGVDNQ